MSAIKRRPPNIARTVTAVLDFPSSAFPGLVIHTGPDYALQSFPEQQYPVEHWLSKSHIEPEQRFKLTTLSSVMFVSLKTTYAEEALQMGKG